ncbi:MAG TPA: hypothetical protein VGY54_07800 [Polyangiaceae bacterium]|jgi:hypothetical protein|nr:hypothetical protein [Polyangiaceae bacterium]
MKDADLDALLARGALSGPTRERVLGGVLDRVSPSQRGKSIKTAVAILFPAAAAVAIWFGGVRPLAKPGASSSAFEARGSASRTVRVDAACSGGPMLSCPRGSRLVFRGWPDTPPSYLAAFADPVGGGERIWYFSVESESPRLGAAAVDRAVLIGPEHAVGRYVIHVIVSTRPISRTQAAASSDPAVIGSETLDLGIVP